MKTTIATLLALALAACSNASEPTTGTSTAALEPAPDLTGTWAFVLDASDVARSFRDKCASDPRGQETCFAAVRIDAANEKIRFSRGEGGKVIWSSFGVEDGKEDLFLEAPVELAQDRPGSVVGTIVGPARGHMLSRLFGPKAMRIEIESPRRIVILDPKKGRLVYDKE